ncbi:chromate resistance protein ChrB domain-containing protein [Dactylosporangium sp. McL0621]|uniref:chromate resistance protein ChrB domain-containing protein n=1 Tax=Dactylosporangium sp. McL0621 TaxID=3415678 RepID=UPI003CF0D88C
MQWVTRERPKVDRIACPWLIRRFIDHEAEIVGSHPSGAAVRAIGAAGADVETEDQRLLERGLFVYDALYEHCRRRTAQAAA